MASFSRYLYHPVHRVYGFGMNFGLNIMLMFALAYKSFYYHQMSLLTYFLSPMFVYQVYKEIMFLIA